MYEYLYILLIIAIMGALGMFYEWLAGIHDDNSNDDDPYGY